MPKAPVARRVAGVAQDARGRRPSSLGSIWHRPGGRASPRRRGGRWPASRARWPRRCCDPSARRRTSGVGQLVADEALVAPVRHDRDVVGRRRRADSAVAWRSDSLAEERQERLRALGSAQRVESGPAAAGHDDGVHAPPILGAATRAMTPRVSSLTRTYMPSQMTLRVPLVVLAVDLAERGHRQVPVLPRVAGAAVRAGR